MESYPNIIESYWKADWVVYVDTTQLHEGMSKIVIAALESWWIVVVAKPTQ